MADEEGELSMFANPYVGITGFMSKEEVKKCLEVVPDDSTYQLMVGVLASSKTLSGEINSKPERYPTRKNINSIFIDSRKAFNCLHFHTDQRKILYDEIMRALECGGSKLNGIQLNLVWPDHDALMKVKIQYPEVKITLQISPNLTGYLTLYEWEIANIICQRYLGLIDYVLIDFGRGTGSFVDLEKTRTLIKAIKDKNQELAIVLAGGLMAKNLILLKPFFEEFPNLSIDAESGLRTISKKGGHLVITDATDYLKKAFWLIG